MMKNKRFMKIYLELTNSCNKKCSHCAISKRKKLNMNLETALGCLEQIAELSDHVYFHVLGEPLTYPNLEKVLEKSAALSLKCHIVTNGLLLKENIPLLLSQKAVHRIDLSLHDADSLESAFALIENAKALADGRKSGEKLLPLVEFRLWTKNTDVHNDFMQKTANKLAEEFGYHGEIDLTERKRGITIAKNVYLHVGTEFEWPDMEGEEETEDGSCMGLKDHCAILSNGNVVACCLDTEGENCLGNIAEKPLNDIITSHTAIKIREGFEKRKAVTPLCKRCKYKNRFY